MLQFLPASFFRPWTQVDRIKHLRGGQNIPKTVVLDGFEPVLGSHSTMEWCCDYFWMPHFSIICINHIWISLLHVWNMKFISFFLSGRPWKACLNTRLMATWWCRSRMTVWPYALHDCKKVRNNTYRRGKEDREARACRHALVCTLKQPKHGEQSDCMSSGRINLRFSLQMDALVFFSLTSSAQRFPQTFWDLSPWSLTPSQHPMS